MKEKLFKEFKGCNHINIIKKYLDTNLNYYLIEKLECNRDKNLSIIKCSNEVIGDFHIVPLNPFSLKDFDEFKSIILDESIMKTTSLFQSHAPSEEKAIENFLLKSLSHILWDIGFYKIYKKDTNELMGIAGINVMSLDETKTKPSEISLGVFFKRKWQGKGLPYQSIKNILKYTLTKVPDVLVWASALSNNLASHKILVRLGLKHKGQICKYAKDFPVEYFEISGKELIKILQNK